VRIAPAVSLALRRQYGERFGTPCVTGRLPGALPVEFGVDVELYEFDRTVGGELSDDGEAGDERS